jgi:AraC-like DNA-binding protein
MYSINLHEKKQHGTPSFPVAYYYVDASHPQYHMPVHWHKEWELIRIQKGSLILHADQQEIIGTVGDFFLIRDSMLHGFTPQTDCIYDCLVFDLHGLFRGSEAFQKFLRPIYRLEFLPEILYHKESQPELYALADALMQTHSSKHLYPDHATPNYHELITVSEISLFFAYILQNKLFTPNEKSGIPVPHRIDQIRAVLEYIEQHYSSTITLSSMATVAGMNPKYFCRVFKEVTQQTPMDYVIFYRVEQSANMLTNTDLSVLEIAMECGFNDYSYFIKTFKKLKSMTPKQYRLK